MMFFSAKKLGQVRPLTKHSFLSKEFLNSNNNIYPKGQTFEQQQEQPSLFNNSNKLKEIDELDNENNLNINNNNNNNNLNSMIDPIDDLSREQNKMGKPLNDEEKKKQDIAFKTFLLKRKFVEWSETSTSHGYPNIFRTNKLPIQIFWFILLIISTGLCIYMVSSALIDYLKYETTSKISIKYERQQDLPMISVCNSNPFLTDEAKSYFINFISSNPEFINYMQFFDTDINSKFDFYFSNSDQIEWFKSVIADPNFNQTLKQSFGFHPYLMFSYVQFGSNTDVNVNDYFKWYIYIYIFRKINLIR